jgi:hypothetical protein
VLARVGVASIALLAALGAAEATLHVFDLARPEPRYHVGEQSTRESANFAVDDDTGWRMRPDHAFEWATESQMVLYRSDAAGFRVGSAGTSSAPGELVLCGDSFAFGTGVDFDECFGAIVARELDLPLRNFGMPGFGVDQIVLSVERHALPRQPALLLVALYDADFARSFSAFRPVEKFTKPRYVLDDGKLRAQTPDDAPPALAKWVESNSRVFALLRSIDRRIGLSYGCFPWWELNEALLDRMLASAQLAGLPRDRIVLIYVPSKLWRPFPALAEFAKSRGVRLLDPVADSDLGPDGLYYERDSHLNRAGHAAFGAWIASRLKAP